MRSPALASKPVQIPTRSPRRTGPAKVDAIALGAAALLVAVTAAVAVWLEWVGSGFANANPLFGDWKPHLGPGTPAAVITALAVVLGGPRLARRLRWRTLLLSSYAAAVAWILGLALIDGWQRGLAGRLAAPTEYLPEVRNITDISRFVDDFVQHIPQGPAELSWTAHVAGHPPGATLVFLWLDRLGLDGGGPAAIACVLAGALAAVAVPVTVRALGGEAAARVVVPFAVLFPGAVWIGVSADGLFAGVGAVGIALLALAATGDGPRADALALAGGLLLGYTLYLSYGLVLLALPVLAVALLARRLRPLLVGGIGVLAVAAAFTLAGFWWYEGYLAVVERYHAGISAGRPYEYWVFANLAALMLSAGPLAARVVPAAVDRWAGRLRSGVTARVPAAAGLVLAAAAAILVADLSGLSKAETERIWLPFSVWLVAGAALLPIESRRFWLVAQAVTALLVNHLVSTPW